MSETSSVTHEVTPAWGEKTIRVQIKLFTDEIAPTKGKIVPLHARPSGYVVLEKNRSHGIDEVKSIFFHDLDEIPGIIAREVTIVR